MNRRSILERWQLSADELTGIIDQNPSLRGFLLGYVGEYKLQQVFHAHSEITSVVKPDDHSRAQGEKSDLIVTYRGRPFSVEVKSLQTNSIHRISHDNFLGKVQVDASDKRPIRMQDGSLLETTCLLRGEFDLLAVSLFQFRERWEYAFALNRDLPSSRSSKYTPTQRSQLLATSIEISLPLRPPFASDPLELLALLS